MILAAARSRRVPSGARAVTLALPRAVWSLRHSPPSEPLALAGLVLLSLLSLAGSLLLGVAYVPPGFQIIAMLGGGLLLRPRSMRLLLVVVAACLAINLKYYDLTTVRPGALVVVLVTAIITYQFTTARAQTGLAGATGDSFLVELRERLLNAGQLPALPQPWGVEAVVRPAGGAPFAGDFVVSALTGHGRILELALVDVSGKGTEAGTRALLLSGALGGLLGSLRPDEFLPAANRYLDRQEWDESFATAVHLVLDLQDGGFSVESAGHPPVAHFDASSGRWSLLPAEGFALGLVPEVAYVPVTGRLDRGDALVLYTDGLVEIPHRDLAVGIDKLLGEAERLVPRGFHGGADLLVRRVAGASNDDRGLVLLWREG
jgi:hypothetical protein